MNYNDPIITEHLAKLTAAADKGITTIVKVLGLPLLKDVSVTIPTGTDGRYTATYALAADGKGLTRDGELLVTQGELNPRQVDNLLALGGDYHRLQAEIYRTLVARVERINQIDAGTVLLEHNASHGFPDVLGA